MDSVWDKLSLRREQHSPQDLEKIRKMANDDFDSGKFSNEIFEQELNRMDILQEDIKIYLKKNFLYYSFGFTLRLFNLFYAHVFCVPPIVLDEGHSTG